MSHGVRLPHYGGLTTVITAMVILTGLAAAMGHPGLAEVIGGATIVAVAVHYGRILTLRLAVERDPSKQLVLDLLLVLVVVLGLVGIGVMAVAIP